MIKIPLTDKFTNLLPIWWYVRMTGTASWDRRGQGRPVIAWRGRERSITTEKNSGTNSRDLNRVLPYNICKSDD